MFDPVGDCALVCVGVWEVGWMIFAVGEVPRGCVVLEVVVRIAESNGVGKGRCVEEDVSVADEENKTGPGPSGMLER